MQWEWNHSYLNISYCFESPECVKTVVVKGAQGRKTVCCSICPPSPGIHCSEIWLVSYPALSVKSVVTTSGKHAECKTRQWGWLCQQPPLCVGPYLFLESQSSFRYAVLPSHNSQQSSEMTDILTLPAYGLFNPAETAFLWELQPLFPSLMGGLVASFAAPSFWVWLRALVSHLSLPIQSSTFFLSLHSINECIH
jgi:hypothetical protein